MTYGSDEIQARRRTIYISPKLYRMSKIAAKECDMTWSEYVEGCVAQQLVKELKKPKRTESK